MGAVLSNSTASSAPSPPPGLSPAPPGPAMDKEFILRNQVVERYLSGRLPLKGAQDFERFCRENPNILDELHLADQVHAGLRLLNEGGQPAPWELEKKQFWERLPVFLGAASLCVVLAVTSVVLSSKLSTRSREADDLKQRLANMPIDPTSTTRTISVIGSRDGPSRQSLVTVGGPTAQMADLKFSMVWSKYTQFQVLIERLDQGRVAILHNQNRDSNGDVRVELNTSALAPGDYQFSIQGLTWKGEPVPQSWATITVAH